MRTTVCVCLLGLCVIYVCEGFHTAVPSVRWPSLPLRCALGPQQAEDVPSQQQQQQQQQEQQYEVVLQLHDRIGSVPKQHWDALLSPNDSPFLEHDFIRCLEDSGCACPSTGWVPMHLTAQRTDSQHKGELLAAMPLYLKYHSMGEFIFDDSWAEHAMDRNLSYYPKILSAVPFTPASGARLLVRPGLSEALSSQIRTLVAQYIRSLASQNKLGSANVNFLDEDSTLRSFKDAGFLHRKTVQYRWTNRDKALDKKFESFDEYLETFKAKRRKEIKRERRIVYDDQRLQLRVVEGDDITPELMPLAFEIYRSTIDKLYWGRQYLNREFFEMLGQSDFKRHLCIILAESDDAVVTGRPSEATGEYAKTVAGTVNIVKANRFYGRYWGSFYFFKNLHFETCYYKSIEHCISRGLNTMEPGAGGGDFKYLRGFDPYIVNSVHYCTDAHLHSAVKYYLLNEAEHNTLVTEHLIEHSYTQRRDAKPPSAPNQ